VSTDSIRDLRQRAEDAAYTAVGVGVLGFQQAQVRRRAVQERLTEAARDARGQATTLGGDAWSAVEALGTDVRGRVEPVVSRLGERVDPVVADVRARVEPLLATVGSTVRRVAGNDTPDAPSDPSSTN
jgi:hypothetical protein